MMIEKEGIYPQLPNRLMPPFSARACPPTYSMPDLGVQVGVDVTFKRKQFFFLSLPHPQRKGIKNAFFFYFIMEEDTSTRQSSKLSLGSSPSVLSADEQLDGDGPLTPTDKLQDDDDEEDDDDDDDLSALNSILQAGSPGSLSNEEVSDEEEEEEDTHTEQDSASPLSSVPDDFPLSRSASPELPLLQPLPVSIPPVLDEDEEEEEEVVVEKKKSVRKRRSKDSETPSPTKKTKAATIATTAATNATTTAAAAVALVEEKSEEAVKKRRASRSITNHILTDPPSSRPRRRQSRQDEVKVEEKLIQHDDEIMQEITVPKQEEIIEKEASFDHLQKMDTLQENADCEDKAMNEAQGKIHYLNP